MKKFHDNFNEISEKFLFSGEHNIMKPQHYAIMNDKMTVGTDWDEALSVKGMWAPPYASIDFFLEAIICGERVRTSDFTWYPYGIERRGTVGDMEIETLTALCANARTFVMQVRVKTTPGKHLPVQIFIKGCLDYVHFWEFNGPHEATRAKTEAYGSTIEKRNENRLLLVQTSLENMKWFELTEIWESEIFADSNGNAVFYLSASIGREDEVLHEAREIAGDYEAALQKQFDKFNSEAEAMFEQLPQFDSDNKDLQAFYYRSLLHYITNKWEIPELVLRPYYSTGGSRGGCFCDYLWDYSAGWEMHPLFDPQATRAHILHFLSLDLTQCFAFNPLDGKMFGPCYPVNHEKILGLIRYYVLITGDLAFLSEIVGGMEVWEWAVMHAMINDDNDKDAVLTDYGIKGEHHLELRRGIPYCGIMPDLNGRRVLNYHWVADIAEAAGYPQPELRKRATALAKLVNDELWDSQRKWYAFIHEGKRDFRYTVQMFKLIGNPVLDEEKTLSLLSHLNEDEFYSTRGLHSMSKQDIAYDQVDIDNGGGGNCTIFPTAIAERLYKNGRAEIAAEILQRILWWGVRVPYWGDSFVANYIDYRQDTPLQCTIGGVTGAQTIIFGMFCVDVTMSGEIRINPAPPEWARKISLTGLRLRGRKIDIHVDGNSYEIIIAGKSTHYVIGETAII